MALALRSYHHTCTEVGCLNFDHKGKMVKAESSTAGARNGITANTNGAGPTNYELPWYAP